MLKKLLPLLAIPLIIAGCTTETPMPEGSLEPMSGTSSINRSYHIGQVTITDPVALFNEPGGITLGRLETGEFPVVKTREEWIQIDTGGNYYWVPATDVHLEIFTAS